MGRDAVDMTGETHGELTVLSRAIVGGKVARWECICVCGRHIVARRDNLISGRTKSCGECGVFHNQELTAENAKYVLVLHIGPKSMGSLAWAFGAAYLPGDTEGQPVAVCHPRQTANPRAGIMTELGERGLVRPKDTRPSARRWAQEERCVYVKTHGYTDTVDLYPVWRKLAGIPETPEQIRDRERRENPASAQAVSIYARTAEEMAETRRKLREGLLDDGDIA